jgi:filamentous hemagglutinin
MILDTLKANRNSTELGGLIGSSNRVVRMNELSSTLNANGLNSSFVRNVSVDDLAGATSVQNPAIVAIKTPQGGHAVVVDGITTRLGQRVVAIRDPHGTAYFQTVEEFDKVFMNQAVIVK